jgi:CBS domain-containing protein
MRNILKSRNFSAGVAGLIFAVVAAVFVIVLQTKAGIKDSAIIVALLIAPLLVYGVVSGRLRELSGPGGWGAKFAEAASGRLEPSREQLKLTTGEMEVIPKESVRRIAQRLGKIKDGRPVVLTMTLGRGTDYYKAYALVGTIDALSQLRNFKFVVIIDEKDRLIAYMPSWTLKALLTSPIGAGDEFVRSINEGHDEEVINHPLVITETVTANSSNTEALAKMESLNLEALVVVDEKRRFRGVVERDRILAQMLIALAEGKVSK